MEVLFRRHWTSLLGILFILAAFITLFKYSLDQQWITDGIKIGSGLLTGAGLCAGGLGLTKRGGEKWQAAVQTMIGLGACVLYATFSFAGIYYDFWSPMTVLIGMSAVTAGVAAYAHRFDSRLLMIIALAGGLLSPLLMQPETDQAFTLFLYLLVMNAVFFLLSVVKKWTELRLVAFVGTWAIYAAYYIHFDPFTDGLWSKPIRYALATFAFYLIAFLLSSWKSGRRFDGLNLYASFANSVLFGCWAIPILHGDLHYAYILASIGVAHLAAGLAIWRLDKRLGVASISHLLGGGLLLLLAVAGVGSGRSAKPLIDVFVWGGIAGVLATIGQIRRSAVICGGAVLIWLSVGIYWFAVTWTTPRGDWFGTFIPFLNWGALSWMLLALIGFRFAVKGVGLRSDSDAELRAWLPDIFALLSHLIVGGLLTVQIQNVHLVYFDGASRQLEQLSLSLAWGVYALLLFLWGAYSRQVLFKYFGSAMLLVVAFKAILLDLSGQQMLYKVVVLLLLGGISFLVTWINGKWKRDDIKAEIVNEH